MAEPQKVPNYVKFIIGGLGGMTAQVFVQPMDLAKTRMQMAGIGGAKKEYANTLDCLTKVVKNEGIIKLFYGLDAALLRQATYTTARMGVYQMLLDHYKKTSPDVHIGVTMAIGIFAGAVGALVGNPADLILIRTVTDGKLPPEQRRNYKHVFDALIRVTKEDGVLGLWRGVGPTTGRAMVVNMAELASYSQFKNYFKNGPLQMKEGLGLHVAAGTLSGFITTIASMPIDMAKTRIQNMKTAPGAKAEYSGAIDVLVKVCKHEGVFALWKGFTPYLARLCPHAILQFVFVEQYFKLYYKYVLGAEGGKSNF